MSAPPEALPSASPIHRPHGPAHTVEAGVGRASGTALLELRLNLASPGPWIVAAVLALFGTATVWMAADNASFPVGWILSAKIGPLACLLLLFLAAGLANRPQRYDLTELLDSKVAAGEELIAGRWVGMAAAIALPLLLEYGAATIAQAIHSKSPVQWVPYLQSLGRLLPPVLFFCTLSFCLVTLTRNLVLGAGLGGFVWFLLRFGTGYYPTFLRPELSQNGGLYLGLTGTVLLLMLLGYRGRRRAKRAPVSYGLGWSAGALGVWTALHAGWLGLALPGKERAAAEYQRMRGPRVERREKSEPLPNLAWSRADGRRVSLAGMRGKPVLLFLFPPDGAGAVPMLRRVAGLQQEFAAEGLQVLPVCLSEDLNAGDHAARAARIRLAAVTDWGEPSPAFDPRAPTSIATWALRIGGVPAALLLDRRGKVLKEGLPLDEESWPTTRATLRALLHGEPAEEAPSMLPGGGMLP